METSRVAPLQSLLALPMNLNAHIQGAVHGSHWALIDVTRPLLTVICIYIYIHVNIYMYIYNMTFWHYFDHGQTMDIRMTMVRRWWWWCRPQFLVGINHQSGCEVRIWIHWFFGGWMWLVVLPHSFWRFLGTDMCICQIQSGQWSYQHLAKRRRHLVPSCAQLCPVVQAFQQLGQPRGTSISNGWSSAWSTSPGHSWVLIRVDAASGPSCDVVSFFPEIFSWNILE